MNNLRFTLRRNNSKTTITTTTTTTPYQTKNPTPCYSDLLLTKEIYKKGRKPEAGLLLLLLLLIMMLMLLLMMMMMIKMMIKIMIKMMIPMLSLLFSKNTNYPYLHQTSSEAQRVP